MSDELDNIPGDLEKYQIESGTLKLIYTEFDSEDDLSTKSEVIFLENISSCSVSDEFEPVEVGGPELGFFAGSTIIGLGLIFLFFEPREERVFIDTIMYYLGFVSIGIGVFGSNLWGSKGMSDGSSTITIQKNSGRDLVLDITSEYGARRMTEEIESAIMLHQQTNVTNDNEVQMGVMPQQTSPKPSVPPAVDTQFLVAINKEQWGPYGVEQLQQMINQGSLQRDTLVWNQSMPKWTMACEVPELTGLFGPPPIPD